jgi:hypothetical protein
MKCLVLFVTNLLLLAANVATNEANATNILQCLATPSIEFSPVNLNAQEPKPPYKNYSQLLYNFVASFKILLSTPPVNASCKQAQSINLQWAPIRPHSSQSHYPLPKSSWLHHQTIEANSANLTDEPPIASAHASKPSPPLKASYDHAISQVESYSPLLVESSWPHRHRPSMQKLFNLEYRGDFFAPNYKPTNLTDFRIDHRSINRAIRELDEAAYRKSRRIFHGLRHMKSIFRPSCDFEDRLCGLLKPTPSLVQEHRLLVNLRRMSKVYRPISDVDARVCGLYEAQPHLLGHFEQPEMNVGILLVLGLGGLLLLRGRIFGKQEKKRSNSKDMQLVIYNKYD